MFVSVYVRLRVRDNDSHQQPALSSSLCQGASYSALSESDQGTLNQ